jgi:hypothetical protein
MALSLIAGCSVSNQSAREEPAMPDSMQVHYLEIVTPDVDAVCDTLATANGVTFGAPVPELGNARTARLSGGGMVGVRAPMNPTERPVTRPYWLVDDIEAAVAEAERAGATIALPPMHVPGQGTFAIYFRGDTEHGLWQLDAE